jgi:hypothetical protein
MPMALAKVGCGLIQVSPSRIVTLFGHVTPDGQFPSRLLGFVFLLSFTDAQVARQTRYAM